MSNETEYQIIQDDMVVAGASGADALNEIKRYAAQYEQDGPIEVYEVTRKLIDLATPSTANGAVGDMPKPAAWCAPDLKGGPQFGKGWQFSLLCNPQATLALYTADQLRAAVLAERACVIQLCEEEAARWQYPSHGNAAVKMLQSLIRART